MPLRFLQNGGFYGFSHLLLIHAFDGNLVRGMQAWLHLSVRRDPNAVAGRAEVSAHGADQPDIPPGTGQAIEPGNTAVSRQSFQFGQFLEDDCVWNIGLRAELPAVPDGHQLNKAYIHRKLPCEFRQRCNFLHIEAADQHGIDLNFPKSGIQRCMDSFHGLGEFSASRNMSVLCFVQRIKADIQPIDPGLLQQLRNFGQKRSVRGEAEFFNAFRRCRLPAEGKNIRLDQRFSSGNPYFANPEGGTHPNSKQHFLLRQHVLMAFFAHAFFRHAITAAQIAKFRHRQAQIGDISLTGIEHGQSLLPFGVSGLTL